MAAYNSEDYVNAVEWYRKAADQGDANAIEKLNELASEGRITNYTKAVLWFRKTVDNATAEAKKALDEWFHKTADEVLAEAKEALDRLKAQFKL